MSSYSKRLISALGAFGVLVATGLTPVHAGGSAGGMAKQDIVDTAVSAGDFNTLVTAVKAAGLVDTLKGTGPFTVFAPTDEAFAKIPKAKLDALLADKDALTAVLTYHVIAGRIMSSELLDERYVQRQTVQGEMLAIDARSGVKVNDANVVKADIVASNGVIHVIDTVILPPAMTSALEPAVRVAALDTVR